MSKLCSASKKIKKTDKTSYFSKKKRDNQLLYLSFPQDIKIAIVSDMIQKAIQRGLILKKEKPTEARVVCLDKIDMNNFNQLIREVVPFHVNRKIIFHELILIHQG